MPRGASAAVEPEPVARLEDLREDWQRLAEGAGHPFATWEWSHTWWRHFGGGRALYTFACRDESGRIAAILPMYVAARRPVRIARFLSSWADLNSPVCEPGGRALAAAGLRAVTRAPHQCRVVVAERLPGWQGWGELIGGALLRRDDGPALQVGGRTWEEFMATKKRKFRGNLRRAERRLVEDHGLEFRLAEQHTLKADLDTLFRLHDARWGDESVSGLTGEAGDFHRDFAAAALERGWLRLWTAEIEGEPAAAWYGWRFAGTDWHYESGRDPRFDRLSVGTVLLVHTLREAFRDGVDSYNFLAGGEPYKMHFADDDPGAVSVVVGSGVPGRLGATAVRVGYGMPGSARRRLAATGARPGR